MVFFRFSLLNVWYNRGMIKPQVDFPLLDKYRQFFDITDDTIFALGGDIYTNNKLTPDLLVHEQTHLMQQERIGTTNWVYDFLYEPERRLEFEVEAYRNQIHSIKDRNLKDRIWRLSAKTLSSSLYGNIINNKEALELLKV